MLGTVCRCSVIRQIRRVSSLSSSVCVDDRASTCQRQFLHIRPHEQELARRLPRFCGASPLRPLLRRHGRRQSGVLDGAVHLYQESRKWSFLRRRQNVQVKQEDDRQQPNVTGDERVAEWVTRWTYWRRNNHPQRRLRWMHAGRTAASNIYWERRHRWCCCTSRNAWKHKNDSDAVD